MADSDHRDHHLSESNSDEPLDPCFLDKLELLLNSNDQRLIKILDKRGFIVKYTPEDVYNFAEEGDVDNLRTALLLKDNTTNWFFDDCDEEEDWHHKYVALHRAAENGHLECVELLLNAGADINIQHYDYKETPLHLATRNGHSSVVAMLIARGANIEMISNGYDYDSDWYGYAVAVAAFFNHKDIVEMLYEKDAENPINTLEASDDLENALESALKAAARNGSLDCLNYLLDVGVDVNSHDSDLYTPLDETCFYNQIECARVLILRGADVNVVDCDGSSPLICAASNGNIEICRMLLDNQADINGDIDKYKPPIGSSDCRPMILAETEHRCKRATFDSFIDHHIEYPPYKNRIYSICYPHGNIKIAEPPVGWSRAEAVRNKYYFDEIFFYLHLNVGKIITNSTSDHYSNITALVVNSDATSTLMTVLVDRLKLYLKPASM
jgi:hypothetical protein